MTARYLVIVAAALASGSAWASDVPLCVPPVAVDQAHAAPGQCWIAYPKPQNVCTYVDERGTSVWAARLTAGGWECRMEDRP